MTATQPEPDVWPTPQQWVDRFLAESDAQRLERATRVLEITEAANQCFRMNHAGLQDAVNRMQPLHQHAQMIASEWSTYRASGGEVAGLPETLVRALDAAAAQVTS